METCPNCQQAYIKFNGSLERLHNGGKLTVTDVPKKKCQCDTTISLSDGIIADLYKNRLNIHGIAGDVTISLIQLQEQYKAGEIMDCVYQQRDLFQKIDWLKKELNVNSNEELINKALESLFKSNEKAPGTLFQINPEDERYCYRHKAPPKISPEQRIAIINKMKELGFTVTERTQPKPGEHFSALVGRRRMTLLIPDCPCKHDLYYFWSKCRFARDKQIIDDFFRD